MLENPLRDRISIEMEGNIPIDIFIDFFDDLDNKIGIYIEKSFKDYLSFCDLKDCESKRLLDEKFIKNTFEINYIKGELTILLNKNKFYGSCYVPTELILQMYNIFDKKTFKIIKKACKVYDCYHTPVDPYEAIHVNFDARSFFPFAMEIYKKNQKLFDFNERYRRKIDDKILRYHHNLKSISLKTDSIDIYHLKKDGRIEFRILNSDEIGRKKLIKFLKNAKNTYKKGLKKFNLICFDKDDFSGYKREIKNPAISNDPFNPKENFKTFEDFLQKHKVGETFVVEEFFSMPFEKYKEIL